MCSKKYCVCVRELLDAHCIFVREILYAHCVFVCEFLHAHSVQVRMPCLLCENVRVRVFERMHISK